LINYSFLEFLYGLPRGLTECKARIINFVVVEHHIHRPGSKYLYLVKKPSGIDFISYINEIAKRLEEVNFAGIKDSVATAYFYVSSSRKIENPSKNIWFIGRTAELSPASNSGNSFRISIKVLNNKNCNNKYEVLKEKICNQHPAYFVNFYGYQRFGLKRPTNHVIGKTLKNGYLPGTWLYIRSKYHKRVLSAEKRILGKARNRLGIIPPIPSKVREVTLESYTSYFFNRVLNVLLKEIGGLVFETEPLLSEKMFWINKIPCGNRLNNAFFVKTENILNYIKHILSLEKVKPRLNVFKRRPILAPVCNYSCKDRGTSLDLVFTLPTGSYATMFLWVLGIFSV